MAILSIAKSTPNDGIFEWLVRETIRETDIFVPLPDGQYLIEVRQAGTSNFDQSNQPFSIVAAGANLPPVIHGVSGPTTLKVGETGTWTVKASDPENGPLSYAVVWGDEAFQQIPLTSQVKQTATFTHSYAKAGVYNPTFTVTDNAGLSAKTSISVKVESSYTCTDSDGGKDYYVKGTVTLPSGYSTTDYCIISPETGKETNTLREFSCSLGGGSEQTDYKCPNGCKDGACILKDGCIPDASGKNPAGTPESQAAEESNSNSFS